MSWQSKKPPKTWIWNLFLPTWQGFISLRTDSKIWVQPPGSAFTRRSRPDLSNPQFSSPPRTTVTDRQLQNPFQAGSRAQGPLSPVTENRFLMDRNLVLNNQLFSSPRATVGGSQSLSQTRTRAPVESANGM